MTKNNKKSDWRRLLKLQEYGCNGNTLVSKTRDSGSNPDTLAKEIT